MKVAPMKLIVTFGTTHEYQTNGHFLNQELGKRLDYLRERFGAQVLLEEWSENRPESFARAWASGIGIDWVNIGPPDEVQFRTYAYAPVNHPGHDGTLPPDFDAPSFAEYGPFNIQEKREQRMTQNIQNAMTRYDTGLLLLGLAHLHSMLGKLGSLGFQVTGYHWLLLARTPGAELAT
jgi:hypothetical protein